MSSGIIDETSENVLKENLSEEDFAIISSDSKGVLWESIFLVSIVTSCSEFQVTIAPKSFNIEALGATVDVSNGNIAASAKKLVGTSIYMDVVSVGATINIMLFYITYIW